MQSLWSEQSTGALRSQCKVTGLQLHDPLQVSWLNRWHVVSPALQGGGTMHPDAVSQTCPEVHMLSTGVWVQAPRVGSHASAVQESPSSQRAAPPIVTQRPARHSRASLQKFPP